MYNAVQSSRSAKVISIANQKGGCGKTTSAVSLASILADAGAHVLLIDLDTQASATLWLAGEYARQEASSYEVLVGKASIEEVLTKVTDRLHLVPANADLGGAELDLAKATNGEMRLRKALSRVRGAYDYILIDTPPNLMLCTQNALTASSYVVIPVDSKPQAYESIRPLLALIGELEEEYELSLGKLALPTIVERTNVSRSITGGLLEAFENGAVLPAISKSVRLVEAYIERIPILEYDPNGPAVAQYRQAAEALRHAVA
jgi:chromosome partitioning protein